MNPVSRDMVTVPLSEKERSNRFLSLPFFQFSELPNRIASHYECPLCHALLKPTDIMVMCVPCGHAYHRQCLKQWLLHTDFSCPSSENCPPLRTVDIDRARLNVGNRPSSSSGGRNSSATNDIDIDIMSISEQVSLGSPAVSEDAVDPPHPTADEQANID
ncbi:43kDa postsynaptic protein [Trema orientale]|uniref:43kDa postsynaptic protein n=1 Tax=Trema orientale TaxID=63057 RepID=A0A2P5FS97_TREOI|nr:43kDa postsynaptic protein [Trema orientale]